MLTDSQLASIQSYGERYMTTAVQVQNRLPFGLDSDVWPTDSGDGDYFDDTIRYGSPFTTKGWLSPIAQSDKDEAGYQVLVIGEYRLRVPVGTVIGSGDMVTINGRRFTVIDATTEQTWPEWITCRLVRGK